MVGYENKNFRSISKKLLAFSDDYAQESGFYFSPYGEIGLTNHHPKKVNGETSKRAAPHEENRDILDLNRNSDIADQLDDIIRELDDAGNAASAGGSTQKGDTLGEMIKTGKVKGLPRGTEPEIGLEQQGIALPLGTKPTRNNMRMNPMQRPGQKRNGFKTGGRLLAQLQSSLLAGKIKNANNLQRLPNVGTNGFHAAPNGYRHYPQQQQLVRPQVPALIGLDVLNAFNLDTNAYRSLMQKNQNGGMREYFATLSANLVSKYDMSIQRTIAEKQKKCLYVNEDGDFAPVSSDGPGVTSECLVLGTTRSLNSRFSAI